jgi:hypothetical protein
MTAVLDDKLLTRALGELERFDDIPWALDFQIVRGQITLAAVGVCVCQGVCRIAAIEEALISGIGCPHLILVVHVATGRVGSQPWVGIVCLNDGAGGLIASYWFAIVAREARQGKRQKRLDTTPYLFIELIQRALPYQSRAD